MHTDDADSNCPSYDGTSARHTSACNTQLSVTAASSDFVSVAEVATGARRNEVGEVLGVGDAHAELILDVSVCHRMVVDMHVANAREGGAAVPAFTGTVGVPIAHTHTFSLREAESGTHHHFVKAYDRNHFGTVHISQCDLLEKCTTIARMIFHRSCLLYTSPSPRDRQKSRMPSSA